MVPCSHPEAPKEIAVMYEGNVLSQQLFGIQIKDYKIAANEVSPSHFEPHVAYKIGNGL
jgi:hypothetical protein